MNILQTQYAQQYLRVVAFGNDHPDIFAPAKGEKAPGTGGKLLAELSTINASLSAADTIQGERTAKAASRKNKVQRNDLRATLKRIHSSIPYIAADRGLPELIPLFELTRTATDAEVIRRAEAFLKVLEAHQLEPDLIKFKHPPGIIKELRAQLEAFRQLKATRQSNARDSVATTQNLKPLIARGKIVVSGLNSMVQNTLRDDPMRLAQWAVTLQLPRQRRGKKKNPKPGEPGQADPANPADSTTTKPDATKLAQVTEAPVAAAVPVAEPEPQAAHAELESRASSNGREPVASGGAE